MRVFNASALPSFVQIASRIVGAASQAVLLIVLAREVNSAEFGAFSITLGVAFVIMVASDFGLSGLLLQELAAARHGLARQLATASLLVVPVAGLGTLLGGALLPVPTHLGVLIGIAVWAMSERLVELQLALAVGSADYWRSAGLSVARRMIALVLFIALLRTSLAADDAAAISLAVGGSFSVAALGRWGSGLFERPSWGALKESLARARMIFGIVVLGQVRELETVVMGFSGSLHQTGQYALAFRLTRPASILGASLAPLVIRAAVVDPDHGGRGHQRFSRAVLAFGSATLAFASFVVGPVISAVAGPGYADASAAFIILGYAVLFGICFDIEAAIVQGSGRYKAVLISQVVGGVVTIIGVYCGGMAYGATGAAAATLAAAVARLSSLWLAKRHVTLESIRGHTPPDSGRAVIGKE